MKTLDISSLVLLLAMAIMAQLFSFISIIFGYLNSAQSTNFGWLVGLGLQKNC